MPTVSDRKTTIRLPPEVDERLRDAAARDRRSVHAQMLVYIERGLDADSDGQAREAA